MPPFREFLDDFLGPDRAELIVDVFRDSVTVYFITVMTWIALWATGLLFKADNPEYTNVKKFVHFSHEGSIVLALVAISILTILKFYNFIRRQVKLSERPSISNSLDDASNQSTKLEKRN
jgi:hypothetical protein